MRYNQTDKLIAWLTLGSGLTISGVAVYYSVAGLVAIFAAAVIPIIIMGVALEVSKLIATIWLKWNWQRAPLAIKSYLIVAITILMLITSMGIFGYLSKAHLDQAVPTGDVAAKVALLDEKIKTERDNIETSRTALRQMDAQVDARLSRSDDEKGAERAVQIRRQQQAERGRLQKEISDAQARIAKLNEERAPIASELRKVEAEVGPIKYIAALIYGDNPDNNLLEKAVRWVIIIIVLVFDPLAVILLLASQYSFQWFRQEEEENPKEDDKISPSEDLNPLVEEKDINSEETPVENTKPSLWPFPSFIGKKDDDVFEVIKNNEKVQAAPYQPGYEDVAVKDDAGLEETKEDDFKFLAEYEDITPQDKDNIDAAEEMASDKVELEKIQAIPEEDEDDLREEDIMDSAVETEKQAMKAWKHDHPDSSLKYYRKLLRRGVIDKLPWEDYIGVKFKMSDEDAEAAAEAAKWAQEQIEKTGYVQNAEQNESTIWQRVKKSKEDNV